MRTIISVIFLLLLSGCSRDCEHECVIPEDHKPAAEKMYLDCIGKNAESSFHRQDCRTTMRDIYCGKSVP